MGRQPRLLAAALGISVLVGACGPVATPEVIRDFSRANTLTAVAQPTLAPTGPTRTPTATSTPYARPTDEAALDLSQPIVRIFDETITLGQFRARVRYERFKELNNARRIIEMVGLERIDLSQPTEDQAVLTVGGIFNTLANTGRYGRDLYDVMVREAVVRHEFKSRKLELKAGDVQDYWIRVFSLQLDDNARQNVGGLLDQFAEVAIRYSGMTRQQIEQVAETAVMADALRPIISEEFAQVPPVVVYTLKRVVAASQSDADAALKALEGGEAFRQVACRYSVDPAALGNGGALGMVARGGLTPGLQGGEQVFSAEVGALVGPLASPLGFHLFRVNSKRQNADGDALADVNTIVVSTETLANDLKARMGSGERFEALACQYSLDSTGGNGGDYGAVDERTLPDPVALALNALRDTDFGKLVGPIAAGETFEVVLLVSRTVNVPKPEEVEQAKARAFTNWLADQATSLNVTSLSDVWRSAIPSDPLPRDVAPFMIEENFKLPTPVPTATPTPLPGTTTPTVTP
jgi:parvulin-like peptidyl-prolyl isomerase